jgi:hypothetical protein
VAALLDAQGQVALVVSSGSPAETLGLAVGRAVVLEAVESPTPPDPPTGPRLVEPAQGAGVADRLGS